MGVVNKETGSHLIRDCVVLSVASLPIWCIFYVKSLLREKQMHEDAPRNYSRSPLGRRGLLSGGSGKRSSLGVFRGFSGGFSAIKPFAFLFILGILSVYWFAPKQDLPPNHGEEESGIHDAQAEAGVNSVIQQQMQAVQLRNNFLLEHIEEQKELIQSLEQLIFDLTSSAQASSVISPSEQLQARLKQNFQSMKVAKVFWIDCCEHFLWLDRGSDFGFEVGDSVCDGAYLAGYIDRVDDKTCRVRLISDPGLHVAVSLSAEDVLEEGVPEELSLEGLVLEGLLHGSGGVRRLDRSAQLKGSDFISMYRSMKKEYFLGGLLRTSGEDRRFLPGLKVGHIVSYWKSPTGEDGLLARSGFSAKKGDLLFVLPKALTAN